MPDDTNLDADIKVRVTPETRRELKEEAEVRGMTFSERIRQIIRNRHEGPEQLEARVERLEETVRVLQQIVVDGERPPP